MEINQNGEKLSDHKYRDWLDSASKELKEKDLQDLNWQTPGV